jgi:hypothetical protein
VSRFYRYVDLLTSIRNLFAALDPEQTWGEVLSQDIGIMAVYIVVFVLLLLATGEITRNEVDLGLRVCPTRGSGIKLGML